MDDELAAFLHSEDEHPLRDQQLARERAQREAALGQRLRSVERGDLGPSLQRWVSGSIVPVAWRLRAAATASLQGDHEGVSSHLSSAVFGLPEAASVTHLRPILEWLLRGASPGREDSTYAEDLVLACLGTAVLRCTAEGKPVSFTRVLVACSDALRETVIGQFLTTVQGAKAMERVRKGKEHSWQERKQLDAVAALMAGQVRSALGGVLPSSKQSSSLEPPMAVNGREVVKVFNEKGVIRQISLRRPTQGDWAVLNLARHPKGETDTAKPHWLSLAMMILCAAQAEAGWFDLVDMERLPIAGMRRGMRRAAHHKARGMVLSESATVAIQGDLKRWLQMGFVREPMLTPPENGDYLSVKHREVLGARGPMGVKTDAKDTAAWHYSALAIGGTHWALAEATLQQCAAGASLGGFAAACEPDDGRRAYTLGCYGRLGAEHPFHFPIRMDFRGRVYLQPTGVTYQGKDLQKGLLRFPNNHHERQALSEPTEEVLSHVLPLHFSNLFGGPDKLDKANLQMRQAWFRGSVLHEHPPGYLEGLLQAAEDPIQLYTALDCLRAGRWDDIPCQIDGTCNGLQHLSALFRDETAAPLVNLSGSSYGEPPSDIYGEVGKRVLRRLEDVPEPWARRLRATITVDRKLCKSPVMVLPYGGMRATIEDAVLDAILGQHAKKPLLLPHGVSPWHECLTVVDYNYGTETPPLPTWVRDEEALAGNYLAFRDRDLTSHPLLHLDAKRLGGIVWDVIEEVLPRPIQAMSAFRAIAKAVGGRTLEWSTGFAVGALNPLWVIQAKAKSQRSTLKFKGMHLPSSVRGLSLRAGRDEVDAASHTSGIVANFIHSQDADHMARTAKLFLERGGKDFGQIFDCFITRPSQMQLLGECAREAFHSKYGVLGSHPLEQPVRLREVATGSVEHYESWYALAAALGVTFPEMGCWEPSEVLQSSWFFS